MAEADPKIDCPVNTRSDGHAFRGKMFDRFARIEQWACDFLHEHGEIPPTLFGQRLQAVSKLVESSELPSKNRDKLRKLLKELEPYQSFRAVLGHAMLSRVVENGKMVWHFHPVGRFAPPQVRYVLAITEEDAPSLLGRVSQIANELRQAANQPSPRPPSPRAAADP